MRKRKSKDKLKLHPVMALFVLSVIVIILSGILGLFNVHANFSQISPKTGEYQATTEAVNSLLSLSGLKYIFTTTVSNFANLAVLPHIIIILIGIGVMRKSGFIRTLVTELTKKVKKTTVTFVLVFICIIASIIGDLSYIIFIPISAMLFRYGKRNPNIGVIASFAALSCGTGISILLTSIDSSLISTTILNTHMLQSNYSISPFAFWFIMLFATIIIAFIITNITENIIAKRIPKYEIEETELTEDLEFTREKKRGLLLAGIAGFIYLIIFLYNIIPGLPFSGKLLDNSQVLYIDKLFSYDSFFSNGFIFIVTLFFIILGLAYGIGAKTIRNNKDFVEALGFSLDRIGKVLVLIFAAATFISIFKQTNIGNVITITLANWLGNTNFSGLPLIILLFIIAAISTIFLPGTINKWTILAATTIPKFMYNGISPEFAQVVFRFGESVTMGITPVLAYFIVYVAYLEKYSSNNKTITLGNAIKYQMPYSIMTLCVYLIIIIIWYLIGLPLGAGAKVGL